ncbi:MAG: hypothetical protein R2747_12140 [Pyrinomonadaceae bacterium]
MSEKDVRVKEKDVSSPLVRWGIFAGIVLVAFLVGLIPMAVQKWSVQNELAETQKKLRQSEIKGLLAGSIIDAKRGEYEPARQNASGFFTQLNEEQEKAEGESFLKAEDKTKLKPIFDERDTVITMLAQRDPASVDRLTNLYSVYLQAMGVPQPPAAPASPAPEQ